MCLTEAETGVASPDELAAAGSRNFPTPTTTPTPTRQPSPLLLVSCLDMDSKHAEMQTEDLT